MKPAQIPQCRSSFYPQDRICNLTMFSWPILTADGPELGKAYSVQRWVPAHTWDLIALRVGDNIPPHFDNVCGLDVGMHTQLACEPRRKKVCEFGMKAPSASGERCHLFRETGVSRHSTRYQQHGRPLSVQLTVSGYLLLHLCIRTCAEDL